MSSDLTFITNEAGKHLRDRFGVLLGDDTRFFDCLVGYFFISGFDKLHPALTKTEKIRILIGIKTDRAAYELIQTAKAQQKLDLESHAQVRERMPGEILDELQKSGDSADIEDGVHKFVEWIKSGKLEVRAYPSERLHAKLYIMTFHEGDRDKGRVITGSSNLTEAGLQDNLEFNVELKNRSDYDFALQKFNELWAKSVDVSEDYGEKLRGFLARELTLHRLIDFGDAPVFQAIAHASILVGVRTAPARDASVLAYTWQKEMTFERIAQIVSERGQQIRQSELKPDG